MGHEQKIRRPLPSAEEIARLPKGGGPEFNRLVFSASPYLLQHARNPVDWHSWGEEAFALAKKLDKPVFLSVGYATCHWCHVMEQESFEDEAVAKLMNDAFVCVKVDREERPDIDQIYMSVTQRMTGSGGWPMTVIMTPDREPFFAGTYFPKENRYGRPGMSELVPALSKAWHEKRDEVVAAAAQAVAALKRQYEVIDGGTVPAERALEAAYEQLARNFDPRQGGFGRAPKFPTPHNLSFLLRQQLRREDGRALAMVEKTLQAMRRGGIFDHVGFGYHRYSTDAEWLVPHFEKMLYDQALIAIAALECYQLTADQQYARQAQEVFAYVARVMTHKQGGFFSAEDADSEGEEGRFYVWTTKELRELLPREDAELYLSVYNCSDAGNYLDEASREWTGKNIPHLRASFAEIAESRQVPEVALREKLETIRLRLLDARAKRMRPLLDDKILTDWNGLMIAALAIGGRVLGCIELTQRAACAATFVWDKSRDPQGRLLKRWCKGQAGLTGLLDDYAFMTWAVLELHQTTGELVWLERAVELQKQMREHFRDHDHGGFFLTPDDGEKLPARSRDIYDGAIPSGNAVAARNSLRLARLTDDKSFAADAEGVLRSSAANISRYESGYCMSMQALDLMLGPAKEVVVAAPDPDAAKAALSELSAPFLPRTIWHVRTPQTAAALAELAPYTKALEHDGEKTLVYVCENHACNLPTSDVTTALRLLGIPRNKGRLCPVPDGIGGSPQKR